MAGVNDNLIPLNERFKNDPEGLRAHQKMANKKAQEAKQKRKTFKEGLAFILENGWLAKDGESLTFDKNKAKKNENGEPIPYQDAILKAQLSEAMKGNTRAFEVVRDTIGEQPVIQQEIKTDINVSEADRLAEHLFGDKK